MSYESKKVEFAEDLGAMFDNIQQIKGSEHMAKIFIIFYSHQLLRIIGDENKAAQRIYLCIVDAVAELVKGEEELTEVFDNSKALILKLEQANTSLRKE